MKKVDSIISQYENNFDMVEKTTSPSLEQDLKSNMKVYDFDFNLLPPMDRLIVSKINLDVPLIDSKYKNENDFTQWNFDEELENGVVKYPTTPQPGFEWNTLLFGHTSQEWREKNPYGTVFSRISELDQWDEIKLIRQWKLYEYKIVEGYPDGTFRPDARITREEAMTMYQRAMKVTKLVGSDSNRYQSYKDFGEVSAWAESYVKEVLAAHVFNGTNTTIISPKSNLTYAEAAQAVKNLLVESKLINK